MNWQYVNPVKICFTKDFANQLALIIKNYYNAKPAIITSKRFLNTVYFKKIEEKLNKFYLYTDIEENPSFNSCNNAIKDIKKIAPSVIIAIGGGSAIDTAKIICASLYKDKYKIIDILESKSKKKDKPIFIAVPTTHGSGSEVTMWATIWDKQNKIKYSLSEFDNYPDYAIYDVNLVKDLPISISLITTLDALSHAFESIWNQNTNPISIHHAFRAIQLIVEYINKLVEPVNFETRKQLLLASMHSGLAFSNTETAAAHSISYPLTAYYNIPHGIASSMSLFSLLSINMKMIRNEMKILLNTLKINDTDELQRIILSAVTNKLPFKLREYGIRKEDLNFLSHQCFTKRRMDNNIVKLSKKDVLGILEDIH